MSKIDDSRFHRMYANLPLKIRSEICTVINNEPITFYVAYLEIKNKTKIGCKILKQLAELKII